MLLLICRTKYIILCLGWYKTCRGSQGFLAHNLNSWEISIVLVVFGHVIAMFLYCLVVFLFIVLYPYHVSVSQSLVIIVFHPLSTNLMTWGSPWLMLISCILLLSILIKGALKHHPYDDFKQHIKGVSWINIGLSLNWKTFKFKLPKGAS